MSNHSLAWWRTESGQFAGRCSCRTVFPQRDRAQGIADAHGAHLRDVERARASARRGAPTLRTTAAYFRERANDTTLDKGDRDLWAMLADEAEARLAATTPNDELGQGALF